MIPFRDSLLLYLHMFRILFSQRTPEERSRRDEIIQAIVHMSLGSLPIITLSTAFSGMVITDEIAYHMDKALHDVSMIPGSTGQLVLREIGIVIPALLMVSKVGASIAAEIGTMKVTEQIDALRLLQIDPIRYLVYPRWIASLFSGIVLTLIAAFTTLSCAILVAITRYHFSFLEYVNSLRHFVGLLDLVCAVTKGLVFGSIIPIIACSYGFHCKGGAQGVGEATTNAVVTSTLGVIILDFILTYLFSLVL